MIAFSNRSASPEEFIHLRVATGLSVFAPEATAATALAHTLYGGWLGDGDTRVSVARLTSDRGCFAFMTDVAMPAAHQCKGLGLKMMTRLMTWVDANLPSGLILSLIADEGVEGLYCKTGCDPRQGMLRPVS